MRRVFSPPLTPATDNTLACTLLFWWHHFKWKGVEDADRRPEQSWSISDLPEMSLGWGWTGWRSREQSEILITVQTPGSKTGWSHYIHMTICVNIIQNTIQVPSNLILSASLWLSQGFFSCCVPKHILPIPKAGTPWAVLVQTVTMFHGGVRPVLKGTQRFCFLT